MKHEDFPVNGFEFMNEPATKEQKETIVKLLKEFYHIDEVTDNWPDPFSKWDAANMITELQHKIKEKNACISEWVV
jgi:hypothetical protein